MKLGLIAMIAVLALVVQVFAKEFYLVSLFVLNINVGKLNTEFYPTNEKTGKPEKKPIKKIENADVTYRLIMFTGFSKEEQPSISDINWKPYYIKDFTLTFDQLNYDFKEEFFKYLPLRFELITSEYQSSKDYVYEDDTRILTLTIDEVEYTTKNTQVFSFITDHKGMKSETLIVKCDGGCKFMPMSYGKMLSKIQISHSQ